MNFIPLANRELRLRGLEASKRFLIFPALVVVAEISTQKNKKRYTLF